MALDAYQDHVIDALARLETDMKRLVGNGQPGRISLIETDVETLKKGSWTLYGVIVGISATVSSIVHYLFKP